MYKVQMPTKTTIRINRSVEGETIENKVRRIMWQGEPITDGAPLVYTERKDGVAPEYDIRTDRFEIAVEAMDQQAKAHAAKRESAKTPTNPEPGPGNSAETKE